VAQDGQEIAGYKLLKKIGEGGMGQVFLAEQIRLRRQVAIKLVHLDVKADVPPGGAEPADELTREAEALMALEHPHILSLYDAGRDGETAYLVMPYIPEGSLQDALRPGPRQQLQLPLPPGEALIYLEQAAAALQYAHDRNFIHRDVKPANFLIRPLSRSTSGGRGTKRLHLFLADFGLSKFLAYSTHTTHLSGTPTYMAPEQFQGRAGPASDQYSLAILFYYLLTGDLPFHGSPVELMFHHLQDTPPSPAALVPGIPESLASVIQRGMAKTPEERYPSVASMAEAAREALLAAGMAVGQDSLPAVAAVRPADLQSEKSGSSNPDNLLAPTAVVGSSAPTSTDDMETAREPMPAAKAAPAKPAESSLPTLAGKSDIGSLPTLPVEDLKQPGKPPKAGSAPAERRPRRRGLVVVLAVLAALLVVGGAFAGGLLLQIGPFQKGAPVAQITQAPTQAPTPTPTLAPTLTPTETTPTPSPTAVPAGDILNSILAQSPRYTVDLTQGSDQWDGPFPINGSAPYHLFTPSNAVDLLNGTITFNARTFQTPLALAVDLQAASDQEFDIILDTSDGGSHLSYRLRLKLSAPAQAAHSTDNKTFTVDGTAAAPNTSWADGGKHTLILVLDGTRLLFYLDKKALVDTTIPAPHTSAKLNLASLNQAIMTGIREYTVPSGS
jgi:serine/threonine protein kinase